MTGALILAGDPNGDNEAVRKAYVDTLTGALPTDADLAAALAIVTDPGGTIDARIAAAVAAYLELAGGVMTGPLTLAGAPANPLHAATKTYADLMLPLAGGIMLGALTLSGAPVNALHAATKTYADLMLPLLGGTMGGVLVLAGAPVNPLEAATKAYVDALPVGLASYDAVVAAASGDYTSILTACATEAVGAKIYVKSGTYNEAADIVMKSGQVLEGENPEDTIIDFGAANRQITSAVGNDNCALRGFTVQNSIAPWAVKMLGTYARIENNRIIGTGASFDGVAITGLYGVLQSNYITGFSRGGAYCAKVGANWGTPVTNNVFINSSRGVFANGRTTVSGNIFRFITEEHIHLVDEAVCVGNFFDAAAAIMLDGDYVTIAGNYIGIGIGVRWANHQTNISITGNIFDVADIVCTLTNSADVTITGNAFSGGVGIDLTGTSRFTINGNTFVGTAFISLGAATNHACITGNNLEASTAVPTIADAGDANLAKNNMGVPSLSEKSFFKMKNTSGGALAEGDVVTFKAVAAGDEVTTTVNAGDDLVYGMVDEAINNDAYGSIQVEGKTVKLKVNGTVNIGIGDFLSTMSVAKIARKAAAAHTSFAIALEAYAGADSNGVIDALLIRPTHI